MNNWIPWNLLFKLIDLQLQSHTGVTVSIYVFYVILSTYIYTIGITESRCYCTFTNDGTYEIGSHVLTFISTLNGEIRGTTNHQFLVSVGNYS